MIFEIVDKYHFLQLASTAAGVEAGGLENEHFPVNVPNIGLVKISKHDASYAGEHCFALSDQELVEEATSLEQQLHEVTKKLTDISNQEPPKESGNGRGTSLKDVEQEETESAQKHRLLAEKSKTWDQLQPLWFALHSKLGLFARSFDCTLLAANIFMVNDASKVPNRSMIKEAVHRGCLFLKRGGLERNKRVKAMLEGEDWKTHYGDVIITDWLKFSKMSTLKCVNYIELLVGTKIPTLEFAWLRLEMDNDEDDDGAAAWQEQNEQLEVLNDELQQTNKHLLEELTDMEQQSIDAGKQLEAFHKNVREMLNKEVKAQVDKMTAHHQAEMAKKDNEIEELRARLAG
ncbi:unnamed protein product [Cylindrotheca closterium]|uniref:Uncharacterized protein n=1 Tax=Cylindrotheca closterium TaxID=2856 RepID=A0AAD2FW91_9STRA|nr:unnamed protein product [Cylindrotheca closterium]